MNSYLGVKYHPPVGVLPQIHIGSGFAFRVSSQWVAPSDRSRWSPKALRDIPIHVGDSPSTPIGGPLRVAWALIPHIFWTYISRRSKIWTISESVKIQCVD